MTQPNGQCKLCQHAERVRIELLVASGSSQRAVARKYGLNHHTVSRHWAKHVSEERRAALMLGPVSREALASRIAEESSSVIDHFRAVRSGLYQLYDSAVTGGDVNGGAIVAGRLISCLDRMARLTGELATSPLIQNNTVVNIGSLPEFAQLQAGLMRVLSPYPDARRAVVEMLLRLDQSQGAPAPERPAIEHQAA